MTELFSVFISANKFQENDKNSGQHNQHLKNIILFYITLNIKTFIKNETLCTHIKENHDLIFHSNS